MKCGPDSTILKHVTLICLLTVPTMIPYGVESAKILFFIGATSSQSHRASIQPLANRLTQRGHQVTFLTPLSIPEKQHDKISDFCPPELRQFHEEFLEDVGVVSFRARVSNEFLNEPVDRLTEFFDRSHRMAEQIFKSPSFIPWMERSQFDLIIVDSALNDMAFGLAYYFKAKTIIYGSIAIVFMWDFDVFGLPCELSWLPGFTSVSKGTELSFTDRLLNAFIIFSMSWTYRAYYLPKLDQIVRQNLGERVADMPKLEEVIQNTALMFINSHYSDQFPRPDPPFVVSVGGIHLEEANGTLSPKIEEFLDTCPAQEGFMYISFGSLIKISAMPDHLLQVFLTVIRQSKMCFLLKWDGEEPPENSPPKNLLFRSWFDQKQVLAHPKIRGFIMQGGQVSIQQAIFEGVPLIMMPVFGDQDINAKRMRQMGNGIDMELAGLTVPKLESAIHELIHDPRYTENARKLSEISRDRPMSALDTAVWWTEKVLRTNDTSYLKPGSMHQPLWIHWCLDLWGAIFIFCTTILILLGLIVRFMVRKIFCTIFKTAGTATRNENARIRRLNGKFGNGRQSKKFI